MLTTYARHIYIHKYINDMNELIRQTLDKTDESENMVDERPIHLT